MAELKRAAPTNTAHGRPAESERLFQASLQPLGVGGLPRRALHRILERMHVEFRIDLNLDALARDSGYSRAHFLRMFRAATGKTPHRYLLDLRLEHASRLLRATRAGLSEIALESGFSSHSHLTAQFRRHFGMTPSRYRRTE